MMNKIANSLIVLFILKCLISFWIGQGSIGDGLFLAGCALYIFIKLDLKLAADND